MHSAVRFVSMLRTLVFAVMHSAVLFVSLLRTLAFATSAATQKTGATALVRFWRSLRYSTHKNHAQLHFLSSTWAFAACVDNKKRACASGGIKSKNMHSWDGELCILRQKVRKTYICGTATCASRVIQSKKRVYFLTLIYVSRATHLRKAFFRAACALNHN